jgi:hypothetical protein
MQLTLNDEEGRTLRNLLNAYLPELHREAARTSLAARDLRHELTRREELVERLLLELEEALHSTPAISR